MSFAIGVDTGGTYTDAVLIEQESGRVVASAKSLTTRSNLAAGIRSALTAVIQQQHPSIGMVSLSTTLATNAIVENKGARIAALLVGYAGRIPPDVNLVRELGTEQIVFIQGGHNVDGSEFANLDELAVKRVVQRLAGEVDAFAVSGFFGTRNPEHEQRVREIILRSTNLPVTCGHELTHELDAIRRAATVALNARLIPLLFDLITAVQHCLVEHSIEAPLMVVKGDGSLVSAPVALERPVETILSGPAASLVGAAFLANKKDLFVADMGGTTTDIAVLRGGRPNITEKGAQVGEWRTMVKAVDAHTAGIGGDSRVYWDENGELAVGPRRVIPISLLAMQQPGVVETMVHLAMVSEGLEPYAWEWMMLVRPERMPDDGVWGAVKQGLAEKALPLVQVNELLVHPQLYGRQLKDFEAQGVLQRVGFTPTDAAHVLNKLDIYDGRAACVAAEAMTGGSMTTTALCERVFEQTVDQMAECIALKALAEDGLTDGSSVPFGGLVSHAVRANGDGMLGFGLRLHRPLVAVGAPAHTFFPAVAARLHADLSIPKNAGVANAVGAVVGSVVQVARALIIPDELNGEVRVHLPEVMVRCADLEQAEAYACAQVAVLAEALAKRAGAGQVTVSVKTLRKTAPVGQTPGATAVIEIVIEATAVGRPAS